MIRFLSMIALVAALTAGVLALPVRVPYMVSTAGKVMPAAEWVLVRDQNGSIGTLLRDNLNGTVRSSDVHHFERGDAVRYEIDIALRARAQVVVGDTILRIHSNETHRQLAALSGELAAAQSAVSLYAAGQKEAVVERAERNVGRAVERAEQQKRRLERLRTLRAQQLIAEEELEDAASQLEILEAEVDIARADLEDVSSGSRREQVDLAEAEAAARTLEMQALSERLAMQTIVAPISGIAVRSFGSDTLLTVQDTSSAVVIMPVSWRDHKFLRMDQPVRFELAGVTTEMTGRIIEIGHTMRRLGRDQVVMVTAEMNRMPPETLTGALVKCRVETEPVRLFEYVRRNVL